MLAAWAFRESSFLGLGLGLAAVVFTRRLRFERLLALGMTIGLLFYVQTWGAVVGSLVGALLGVSCLSQSFPQRQGRLRPVGGGYSGHAFACLGARCRFEGGELLYEVASPKARSLGLRMTPVKCLRRCREAPVWWLEPQGVVLTQVGWEVVAAVLSEAKERAH